MEENEHPVWAELRDMQAHERREFEARARGEGSSFSRLNPRRSFPRNRRAERQFHFPWGGAGGRADNNNISNNKTQAPFRYADDDPPLGVRASGNSPDPSASDDATSAEYEETAAGGEWPTRDAHDHPGGGRVGGGGHVPGLLRGLGIGGGGRGLLFSRYQTGGERGDGRDDMGPAEFGLLMGEDGEDGGPSVTNPLLADEWGAVENLDVFFTNMYKYYHSRGLLSIVCRGVAHLVILAFTVLFSTFLLSFVNWKALLSCRDEETCHALSTYVTARALRKPNLFHVLVWMYMLLFLLYWMWSLLSFWASLRDAIDMHHLYTTRLRITPMDLHSIEWSEVVKRFLALQNTGRYRVAIYTSDVTAHDIASRIMRKENYLIAMLNKGILKLSLPLPFLGSRGSGTLWATTGQQYLTKSLEWSVHFCVLNHMFNEKFTVRRAFLDDVRSLRVRLVLVGLAHVVLLPFLLMFMLVYFFLQNAQEWHSSKSYLGPREWTPLARWTFREFNELPHFFEQRMSGSYVHANGFLLRFPRPVLASVMRVTRFVSGAVVAVLLVLTVLEDTILLYVKFWDRNLLWYIGVFSAIYAFSRSVAPQTLETSIMPHGESIEELMLKVAAHTHFMPEQWWGKTHTAEVRGQLLSMFKYKAQLFLEELLSVLFAPIILCFSMPGCAQEIVDFVTEHTLDVEGVGSVCSYSLFDFGRYGDEDYAAPSNAPAAEVSAAAAAAAAPSPVPPGAEDSRRRRRPDTTEQGKMEKSFLNFRANYPDWQPGAAGQEMIDRLAGFQLQCLRKDAETVAANTAAAVAAAAAAAAAAASTMAGGGAGGGGGASHWGQATGFSQAHGMNRQISPGGPRGSPGLADGSMVRPSSVRSTHRHHHGEEIINSTDDHNEAHERGDESSGAVGAGGDMGAGSGDGGAGGNVSGAGAGLDAEGAGGAGVDDERDDHPSPLFPLFSPPRGNGGGGGGGGGVFGGVSTAGMSIGGGFGGGGHAAGGRLSPCMGLGPSGLGPSTLQLGLLNSVSPSMLLGTGGGAAWMGGATGGVGIGGGGAATGGLFGMSTAAPSFVQASQLAPFLMSQMGPQSSWGARNPSQFGHGPHGSPPMPPPPGHGQEQNFYWLERFYAAHRSNINLASIASDDFGPASRPAGSTAGAPVGIARHSSAGRLGPNGGGGGFSRFGTGSAFAPRGSANAGAFPSGAGSRYSAGRGRTGGGSGLAGAGTSPSSSTRINHANIGREEGGRVGSAGRGGGVGGVGVVDEAYTMEMTAQQHEPDLEPGDGVP